MLHTTHTSKTSPSCLVEGMARYVETGNACALLLLAENSIGGLQLRRICISLLSWLKARARLPKMKTMQVSEVGSATASLVKLLETDSTFSVIFAIKGDAVQFQDELPQIEVDEAVSLASKLYAPQRFSTKRMVPRSDVENG